MRVPTARALFLSTTAEDPLVRDARERAFFHAIRTRNGTNKTTDAGRLDDVNAIVQSVLPPERPLEIMDVAVSSGVATLEWMESLDRSGVDYRMSAGDACVDAALVSCTRWLHVLMDRTGYPLQFDFAGRAVPYPVGKRRALLAPPLWVLARAVRWMGPSILRAARRAGSCHDLALVSPRLSSRPALTVLEDDILVPGRFAGAFHVVRAANVLSPMYFDAPALEAMARNLRARLKPRGILVVCRTDDRRANHGSVFRLDGENRLEVVRRFGAGAEREDVIAALER